MEQLTSSQIDSFNNPLAFARERALQVGQLATTLSNAKVVRTGGIEASYRLITGATERLETLVGNLQSMLELSQQGASSRNSEQTTRTIYGKLRSLSAGLDQVVDAIKFEGTPIFDGRNLSLDMGPGGRAINFEASKLLTYGADSLNLSQSSSTAEITTFESIDDVILNQNKDFTGTSITKMEYIEGSNSALELDNDSYKIKTLFAGQDSIIEIRDRFGRLIESQSGVDLSGTGREFVEFDVGIRVEIAKDPILESLGDLTFAEGDYIETTSSFLYRRLDSHTLSTEAISDDPDGAELMFQTKLGTAGSGQLGVSGLQVTSALEGQNAMESGIYTLNVEYRGESSYLRLTDSLGRLRGYQYDVDLTGAKTSVDFGQGLSIDIDNSGLAENGSLYLPIEYNKKPPAIDNFDFREYSKSIIAAIEAVGAELEKLDEVALSIEETNRQRNLASQTTNVSAFSLSGSNAANLLSGGLSGPLALSPANYNQRLGLLANQMFATTTALPTQANQSSQQINSLQQAYSANILGSFS